MSNVKFIIVYDTYCGWCYGAAPVLEALAGSGADVEVLHRYLFKGANAHRMADGFGEYARRYDAEIARLTGRIFSQTYMDSVLGSETEVVESGLTAQAAALVHHKGPIAELSLAARLQHARYVDGVSAADRTSVVDALIREGVSRTEAERIGTAELAAEAADQAGRAEEIMMVGGARGVPAVFRIMGDRGEQISVSDYYRSPERILELAA